MRSIGLHTRIAKDLDQLISDVDFLGINTFQCFFIAQNQNEYLPVNETAQKKFLAQRHRFSTLYGHASYWINLCGKYTNRTVQLLEKEIALAKRLAFDALIIHPGTATGWSKKEGITQLARLLNPIIKKENDLIFILENTAHENLTVGNDLADFGEILKLLDHPEKIKVCVDTAHAYAYGYDLTSKNGLQEFISLIDKHITFQRVSLIHLNDTTEQLASKKDKHAAPGAGSIGLEVLRNIALLPQFKNTPLLLELPSIGLDEQKKIVDEMRSVLG